MPLTKQVLTDAIDVVRGAVMICYPMGLPEWDLVRLCLEANEDLAGTSVSPSTMYTAPTSHAAHAAFDFAVRQRRA